MLDPILDEFLKAVRSARYDDARRLLAAYPRQAILHPESGTLPLSYFAADGNREAVLWLLEYCNINYNFDATGGALFSAIDTAQLDMVRLLIERGARRDSVNDIGDNAVIYATLEAIEFIGLNDGDQAETYTSQISLLVDNGFDVNWQNNHGSTALHESVYRYEHQRKFPCVPEVTELLLSLGANPLLQDRSGESPHDVARRHGDTQSLDIIRRHRDPAG